MESNTKTETRSWPYFPMFVDLSAKRIFVAGAGRVAARRIAALAQFSPCITAAAPEAGPQVEQLAKEGKVTLVRTRLTLRSLEEFLEEADLVFLATNDPQLNASAAQLCRERGIPVNVSSDPELCDFYFPGIARRDETVVGITCSGEDHAGARRLTETIRELLDSRRDPGEMV